MANNHDDRLEKFLTYVDLTDCKPNLEKIGVYRFDHFETVNKRALQSVLPDPAVKRILANVNKFATLHPRKNKYPPLKDFLEALNLTSIQKDLETELKISRVEHLKYATKDNLLPVIGKENAKRILKAYEKLKKNPLRKFADCTKEFGTKVWEMILTSMNVSLKKNNPQAIDAPPVTVIATVPSKPVQPIQKTSVGTAVQTEQEATMGQITSIRHSLIDFENYQQVDTSGDESPYKPSAPNESDLCDISSTSSDEFPARNSWTSFSWREIEELKTSGKESPISQDDWILIEESNAYEGASRISTQNERDRSHPPKRLNIFKYSRPSSKNTQDNSCPPKSSIDPKTSLEGVQERSSQPRPLNTLNDSKPSSENVRDCYFEPKPSNNLNDSKTSPENSQNRPSPPKPLNTYDDEEPKLIEEDNSDYYVLDFFRGARNEDSWQYFDDVPIEQSDIYNVRSRLGDLSDLPEDDIRDALRFVHSEQHFSHFFFDRPPPTYRMYTFVDWHYLYSSRVLTLRHIYAIAPHMTFFQCFEALSSSDWNFNEALSKILL